MSEQDEQPELEPVEWAGEIAYFWAQVDDVEAAFAEEVSDELLREQFDLLWSRTSQPQPTLTDDELRSRELDRLRVDAARSERERLLLLAEAAVELGTSERALRYAIDNGTFSGRTRMTQQGALAVVFEPPPRRWHVCTLRPDPRREVPLR